MFIWYGISVITMFCLSPTVSISAVALITILPLPVSYAVLSSSLAIMLAPVGKSGPLIYFISPFVSIDGLSIYATTASITSPKLWGGMLVATPTAMPYAPLTKRLGKRPGRVSGSFNLSSKFKLKWTVSLSISRKSSRARLLSFISVYLYAAAPSPSIEPKFPWPSISGSLSVKSCAMRTAAS